MSSLLSDTLNFKTKKGLLVVLLTALVVQSLVVYCLIKHQLLYALIFHILSTLLFPWPLWKLMPTRFHKDWQILILFFLMCLLIPLISGLGLLLSLSVNSYFSKSPLDEISNIIQMPRLPDELLQTMQLSNYKGGSVLDVIGASPTDTQRIKAVLKTRQMVDKEAIPILKKALLDSVDEVRLLAYSMLNKKEKKLDELIIFQLKALGNKSSEKHLAEHLSLAEAYWELSYLDLVQGQTQINVLQNAYKHIKKVVKHRMTDAEAYFLQARIALALNIYDVAESSLDQALKFEVNSRKAISYQEELAFVSRHLKARRKNISHKNNVNKLDEHVSGVTESWG